MAKKKAVKRKSARTGRSSQSSAMKEVVAKRKLVKKKKASWQTCKDRTKEAKAAYESAQKDLEDLIDEVESGQERLDFE